MDRGESDHFLSSARASDIWMDESVHHYHQHHHEHAPHETDHTALVVIEGLGLGSLGVDRMMCGQVALGVLKLFTFGGFGIWALVDYLIVMTNAASRGANGVFGARWSNDSQETPQVLAVVFLALSIVGTVVAFIVRSSRRPLDGWD